MRDGSAGGAAPTGVMGSLAHADLAVEAPAVPTFDELYAAHVGFVWRVLQTLGVPAAHLEDAVQDVFVVVHRRLAGWQGRAAITTWLFAIARRVASGHRRRAGQAAVAVADDALAALDASGQGDPFAALSRQQAAAAVSAILATLDEDQRLVLALVELEQLAVPEVARMLGLKLNTAYSRLRLARQAFEAALRRRRAP